VHLKQKKYKYDNKINHKVVETKDENLYQNRGLMTMKIWDEIFYHSKIGENLNLDLQFISMQCPYALPLCSIFIISYNENLSHDELVQF
jgi:hypothetical protein